MNELKRLQDLVNQARKQVKEDPGLAAFTVKGHPYLRRMSNDIAELAWEYSTGNCTSSEVSRLLEDIQHYIDIEKGDESCLFSSC